METNKNEMQEVINEGNSLMRKFPGFVTSEVEELTKELKLEERPPVVVFGKPARQNRNVGFFSDESIGYRYSGTIMKSQPLPGWLKELMARVNETLETNFNGVLVNHYTSGEDYIGAHSDDEKSLGNGSKVAMISFGAVRKFRIRSKETKKIVIDVPTTPMALFTMEGDFQKKFTHEIPVEKKIKEQRWSLTFRRHLE